MPQGLSGLPQEAPQWATTPLKDGTLPIIQPGRDPIPASRQRPVAYPRSGVPQAAAADPSPQDPEGVPLVGAWLLSALTLCFPLCTLLSHQKDLNWPPACHCALKSPEW